MSRLTVVSPMSFLAGAVFRPACGMFALFTVALLVVLLPNVSIADSPRNDPQPAKPVPVCVQGSWAGIKLMNQMIRHYEYEIGSRFIDFAPRDSNQIPEALTKHECDVGMMLDSLAPELGRDFETGFESFPVGRLVVHVAVNAKNSMHTITLEELRDVFSGKVTSWGEISHAGIAGRIELYCPTLTSTESSIFQKKVLHGVGFAESLRDCSAKVKRQKLSTAEIIGAIGKQRCAIGFFLQADEKELDKRVRVLKIAKDKKAVSPSVAAVSDGSYPLWDTLKLYLHPDAPPQARDFCKFASGVKAVKIVKQVEMWPEHELERPRGMQNVAEVRRGKAETVMVCDLTGSARLLNDLSAGFMKVKTAVKLSVQVKGETLLSSFTPEEAQRKLLAGGSELLVVESSQWSVASNQSHAQSPTPNPQSLRSVVLGQMAVGVIVHPKNILDALPLNELRGIFSGEITQWPGANGAAGTIHVYGPHATEAVVQLLVERTGGMPLKYTVLSDNQKVIVEVAKDPFAIGFVDLSQLSPAEKSVKLVNVYLPGQPEQVDTEQGEGSSPHPDPLRAPTEGWSREGTSGRVPGPKSLIPNPQSPIPASRLTSLAAYGLPEDYPLVRTFTLYVSPQAGETAKDFAQFVGSDRCAETLLKHNLLPAFHSRVERETPAPEKPKKPYLGNRR